MIPLGLCQCGCGRETSIALYNHTARGWVKGQPKRFRAGHRITYPMTPEQIKARNREKSLKCYRNMSPERIADLKEKRRLYVQTPEYKERSRKYQRDRMKDPERREKKRAIDRVYVTGLSPEKLALHKAKNRMAVKRWFAENPAKTAEFNNNRRSRVRSAEGSFTAEEWNQLLDGHDHRCADCGRQEPEVKLTVDHVVPVSKGGTNYITNIQPLCGPCNSRKGAKEITRAA